MLFPSQVILDRRLQLWSDFDSGKLTAEAFYKSLLEVDSNDFIGLVGMGKVLRDQDHFADAEQYFWRAIHANPCSAEPFVELAGMPLLNPESYALAMGLAELSMLKKSREDDAGFLKDLDEEAGLDGETLETFRELPPHERSRLIALTMRETREEEPDAVTRQLRPLRLIDQLQEEDLAAATVNAIIAEGPLMVPFLLGILRAWAHHFLEEGDGDIDLENALALLGETGSPEVIPPLLEFIDLENEMASGASSWALGRIIERQPSESAAFAETIAAELGIAPRLKLAEFAIRNPEFDPAGILLERLSGNLETLSKEDRDAFFPPFLITMSVARGRAGLNQARAVLRRHSSLLSRDARRECEDLLVALADGEMPALPAVPSLTVYDICAGDANWEEESREDEDFEDDFPAPPEPVRRRVTPGRNDPCWCNSGKKYKKCHLDSDTRESREVPGEERSLPPGQNEFVGLRKNIGEFLGQVLPQREMKQSLVEFFGDGPQDEALSQMLLIDWMIHDRVSPSLGGTVLEEYLKRRPRLTPRERVMVEAWAESYVGLYEIQHIETGVGGEFKDLIAGETFFVHDVSLSKALSKWDVIFARVVPGERGTEITGSALTVPRTQLQQFREWMDGDRRASGLEWREYLKGNWPRIRLQSREVAADWLDSLRLANSDGEEFLFSKATYEVKDERAALRALRGCPELDDESDLSFVWLDDERTLLANIRIENGALTMEANSRPRFERGKLLIAGHLGESVRHLRDEHTTQTDVKRRAKENPRRDGGSQSTVPKAVSDEIVGRALEQHYTKWVDMKLPALDGKTPRQAAKTAEGRERLLELLKTFENGEEKKRQSGEPFYDVARLRSELGLDS